MTKEDYYKERTINPGGKLGEFSTADYGNLFS